LDGEDYMKKIDIFQLILIIFGLFIIVQILRIIFGGSWSIESVILALVIFSIGIGINNMRKLEHVKVDIKYMKKTLYSVARNFKKHLKN